MSTLRIGLIFQGLDDTEDVAVRKLKTIPGTQVAFLHRIAAELPASRTGDGLQDHRRGVLDSSLLEEMRLARLDCLFNFGPSPPDDHILTAAGGRVFCIQYGSRPALGPLSLYWDLYEGKYVVRAAVAMYNGAGEAPVLIDECSIAACRTSYLRTSRELRLAATDLPVRVVRKLLNGQCLAATPLTQTAVSPRPDTPRALQRLVFRMKMARRWTHEQLEGLIFSEMWAVGVVKAPIHAFLDPAFRPEIRWLAMPGDKKYLADPFAVITGDQRAVIMEEFDYKRNQGYIAVAPLELGADPPYRTVIDERIHMSYPFTLEHQGELFCIPESQRSNCVFLYRYTTEDQWTNERVLIDNFDALDPTVIQYDGTWWMFCSRQQDFPECNLYIWHADDVRGPWRPHLLNPVKCDVTGSRPGGTPFEWNTVLYRPTQNSSRVYGGSVTINRVTKLSKTEFAEEFAASVAPFAEYPDGMHTLSAAGEWTLIDGKAMKFIAPLCAKRFLHKVSVLYRAALQRNAS